MRLPQTLVPTHKLGQVHQQIDAFAEGNAQLAKQVAQHQLRPLAHPKAELTSVIGHELSR